MGTRQNRRYIFGKDEVGGSNPPSSSRKALNLKGFGAFLFGGEKHGRQKKHTEIHTDSMQTPSRQDREGILIAIRWMRISPPGS